MKAVLNVGWWCAQRFKKSLYRICFSVSFIIITLTCCCVVRCNLNEISATYLAILLCQAPSELLFSLSLLVVNLYAAMWNMRG